MQFYKSVNSNNELCDYIDDLIDLSDIILLDNSCVARYENDQMKIGNIVIEQQNDRGFVSVKHIKETVEACKAEINTYVQEVEDRAHIAELLSKHNTTLTQVLRCINRLISGRSMSNKFDNARALVADNQENGTGNWFIFLNA